MRRVIKISGKVLEVQLTQEEQSRDCSRRRRLLAELLPTPDQRAEQSTRFTLFSMALLQQFNCWIQRAPPPLVLAYARRAARRDSSISWYLFFPSPWSMSPSPSPPPDSTSSSRWHRHQPKHTHLPFHSSRFAVASSPSPQMPSSCVT